jgi:hypothetical protein
MLAELEKAALGAASAKRRPKAARSAQDAGVASTGGRTTGNRAIGSSRAGRVNVTGYFDPAVKQSIRMIQAKFPHRLTEQDLLAEALNDLFAKYNVPQTATLDKDKD